MDIKKIGLFLIISGTLLPLPYSSLYQKFKYGLTKYSTNAFFWASDQIAKIKIKYTHLYNENSLVKSISDWTFNQYKMIEPYFSNKKFEPNYSTWILTGTLYNYAPSSEVKNHYDNYYFSSRLTDYYKQNIKTYENKDYLVERYEYLEDYKLATDRDIYNELMLKHFYDVYSKYSIKSLLEIKNNHDNFILNKDNFVLMKYNDKIHIVKLCNSFTELSYEKKIEKSNIHFISIEYKHPNMENPLFLEIPKSYYIVGNELFSPGFVLRCLEYQYTDFVFDDKYELSLIDNEINMNSINSTQYIKILKDEYGIINRIVSCEQK